MATSRADGFVRAVVSIRERERCVMKMDDRLSRLDANSLRVENIEGVPTTLFANEQVPIESSAIEELLSLLELQKTVKQIAETDSRFFDVEPDLLKVAVTPDFHKAAGVPVGTVMATRGFVVPAAIGNDVNCGMRLHLTTLSAEKLTPHLDSLEARLRRTYFQGGRDIAMTRVQREALFREGLAGLLASVPKDQRIGLWDAFHRHAERDLKRVEQNGSLRANTTFGLSDFLGPDELSRDNQIGSIGGGNHFVEIQRVERVLDGTTAHAWGLKPGMVTVMVHTGSVAVGHLCGSHYRERIRGIHPPSLKYPRNGVFVLPDGGRFENELNHFWDCLHNAANFAFANRLFLALMALEVLRIECGEQEFSLLYDAPHNMVWREELDGEPVFIHRKGACPARGLEQMAGTDFAYYGEPVLVPGSMGASSFVLAGRGNPDALWSASHGAGRTLSRGDALKGNDAAFERFMKEFRIVTPVDFRRTDVKQRRDIVEKKLEDIKKEAPFAYKGIGAIIKTLEGAGMARPVAELKPLLTIKG